MKRQKGSAISLIRQLKDRYVTDSRMKAMLSDCGIEMLDEFLDNWPTVERFYSEYYSKGLPKIVLCGINPGRRGAGKTGIPFVDFRSLSGLLPGVCPSDRELSAQFFCSVINRIGAKRFFESFYVTNLSWVGFRQGNKNVNYYKLPDDVQQLIFSNFKFEMSVVKPAKVVAIGKEVAATLDQIGYPTNHTLNHPYSCSFPSRCQRESNAYVDFLSSLMEE